MADDKKVPDQPPRAAALATVGLAAAVGIGAWFWFGRATEVGVERLERIDKMRSLCTGYYAQARDRSDSMRVDRLPLPDTIDPSSSDAMDRCGDMRGPEQPTSLPNPRELGEQIPRGLR
ncbi:MAG: hypothetical protein IBJ03_09250 [Gemmatimonadaceae bacterium]|nr:hypothetical protein [Gemmatimonadaceae bacterium]